MAEQHRNRKHRNRNTTRTHKTTHSAVESHCPLHIILQTSTLMTPKLDFVRPTNTTTMTRKPLGKRLCTNLHLLCLSMVSARTCSRRQQSRHSYPTHIFPPSRPLRTGLLLRASPAPSVPCPLPEPSMEACVSTQPNGKSVAQGSCCPPFIPL